MSNLPLKALVWGVDECTGEPESRGLLHSYIVMNDGDSKIKVAYYLLSGGTRTKFATGFANIDDAKTWCWNHYNEKMQPYVAPMPTWISVDDRLPEKNGGYLAVCKEYEGNEVFLACWHGDGWTGNECIDDAYQYYDSVTVTHWMPIPEFSTTQNLHNASEVMK